MSWFYRKFKKSDDDSTVTLTSDYIQLTGSATLTGALAMTGAPTITGNMSVTGNILNTGNLTVTSTARVDTSPIYLGTGTVAIGWGAVDAAKTGVYISGTTNYGIGSLYINTSYGTLWVKTNHASTAWATMYATPST
jgi:hypothetical protein